MAELVGAVNHPKAELVGISDGVDQKVAVEMGYASQVHDNSEGNESCPWTVTPR